jgi:hypothetical protein
MAIDGVAMIKHQLLLRRPRGCAKMISDSHTIRSNQISATVKAAGAELCSLKNVQELELLWQAGPEWRATHRCYFRSSGG